MDFLDIDVVTPVMSRAIGDKFDQLLVWGVRRVWLELIQDITQGVNNDQVCGLVLPADCVGFSWFTFLDDSCDGATISGYCVCGRPGIADPDSFNNQESKLVRRWKRTNPEAGSYCHIRDVPERIPAFDGSVYSSVQQYS